MKTFSRCLTLILLLCAACTQAPQTLDPPTFTVDATVQPPLLSMPGFEDGEPRPLASVTGEDGVQAEFVANELWLSTDDDAELKAFLSRWQGTVLRQFNPADAGLSELATQYLIRIDTDRADRSRLAADLRLLDATSTGEHKVSDEAGLNLIAASSREAADGLNVGMNWVGGAAQFRDRTALEAPSGSALAGVAYTANAFNWPSHDLGSGSIQNIGVAEAWRALDLAGRLNNRIKLAVLDMGFQPDADWSEGWLAISNVPLTSAIGTKNLLWCGGGNDCPWHGTNAVSAAMARPDNGYGSAGPAGPVAQPVVVYTLYDFFTSSNALFMARIAGARIANMSYGAPIPWYLSWSILPFEGVTAGLRATGMLIFASAGNEGKDVDAEGCTLGVCWERTWYTPCENAGVICVGGLAGNSKNKASGSNYGNQQVDIFAPYVLWLGPDPDAPDNRARVIQGTSFSSPFVAGVAALIWAADPGLSAGQVESILLNTAHTSPDSKVGRYVNAFGAVKSALGNIPPSVTLNVQDGDVPVNVVLTLSADVTDFEDAFPCCTVTWTSNVDGVLGSGRTVEHTFSTLGSRLVTVTARDSGGATSTAAVTLNVINNPPVVTLAQPTNDAVFFRGSAVVLRGSASDLNEPQGRLACERLQWTSSVVSDPFPVTGCEAEAMFSSNGARVLTLTGTDTLGASDVKTVSISIAEPPPNLPPDVRITSPEDRAPVPTNEPITLSAIVTDPEGETELSYEWTAKLGSDPAIVIGTALSVEWTPSDTYSFAGEGTYTVEVRLNVTDLQGNTGTDFVVLEWIIIR